MAETLNTAIRTLVNGSDADSIGLIDRGFQFGDGVFETMVWNHGRIELLTAHANRLQQGCDRLGIEPAPLAKTLQKDIHRVCEDLDQAVVRVFVTRGNSPRGYRIPADIQPNIVVGSYPWPKSMSPGSSRAYRVKVCDYRLARQPELAGIKHMNRIDQIMATREIAAGYDEGLLCDSADLLISGTMTNVFLVQDDTLVTPALDNCGIKGVMRYHILQLAEKMNIPYKIHEIPVDRLQQVSEVFVSNSLLGIRPVTGMDHKEYEAPGRITKRLMTELAESLGRIF